MKQSVVIAFFALLLAMTSCKSHKQVVNYPRTAGREVSQIPKNASSSAYSVDRKLGSALVKEAKGWLGAPYRYGGESKKGTDCSGMLMVIFRDVAKLSLPRNSAAQRDYCMGIQKRQLEPGDLVFFSSSKGRGKVSHVGMYIGSDKIIHASSSRGVIVSGLDERYYVDHYHSSGRVYGITYAATGGKRKSDDNAGRVLLAKHVQASQSTKKDNEAKNKTAVREMTLDEFLAMQQSGKTRDTVVVADDLAGKVVAEIDTAEVVSRVDTAMSVGRCDTVAVAVCEPDPKYDVVKAPSVIVNGRRVEAQPVERPKPQPADSVPADTVRQAEIRETVIKAMNFGK